MRRINLLLTFAFSVGLILYYFTINPSYTNVTEQLANQKTAIGSKENPWERFEYEFRMLKDPKTGRIPENIRAKELEFAKEIDRSAKTKSASLNKLQAFNFISRGPINRGGRTRALGIDVRSTAGNVTIIAAGVSGGIWKSTDNGNTWKQTGQPDLIHSATCIAQDRRSGQENLWYIGTGEARGNSANGGSAFFRGNGIFKSTDNGESWALLPSTASNTPQTYDNAFDFVHNIAVNPVTGTVFAAASNVILKSTNGGNSWSIVRGTLQNNTWGDVVVSQSGTVYATLNSSVVNKGVWKSVDDGANWMEITPTGFPSVYTRIVIGLAPSDANRIYLLAATPGSGKLGPDGGSDHHSFWVSTDGGSSWINRTNNLPDANNVAGYTSQSTYDMVISVKPDNPDFVVFGGTNLFRTTDGLATKINNTAANWIGGYAIANDVSQYANHHPDQHALVFAPFNSDILYSGDDGGIQVTSNINASTISWQDLNTGYITSQFYSVAVDQASSGNNVIIGGLQDNGNYFTNSASGTTPWVELPLGGDGAFTAIANGRTSYYVETQNGNVWRLTLDANGALNQWTKVKPNHSTDYLFINPYVLDPNDTKMMYFVAGDSIWRNSDLTAIPLFSQNSTNVNWSVLSNTSTNDIITAIAISKTPANRLYYGSSDGQIWRLDNANTGNPVPVDIATGKNLADGYVSCLAVDQSNADNVIAVFSNYSIISLYYTGDGGNTWTSISGNLEQNPDGSGNGPSVRWASIMNFNGSKTYFAATSVGLYSTTNLNGASTVWSKEAPSVMGNIVTTMVVTRDADGLVVAATHGAGVYSASQNPVSVEEDLLNPTSFALFQNYPNPFNPSTTISFALPKTELVSIKIFDELGRFIDEIVNETFDQGKHSIVFNASNLSSGVYFYQIIAGNFKQTKKLVLMK